MLPAHARNSCRTLLFILATGCTSVQHVSSVAQLCAEGRMPDRYSRIAKFSVVIDSERGATFVGDGFGAYSDDSTRCVAAQQQRSGLTQVAFPVSSTYGCRSTTPHRTWSIDLSHPVDRERTESDSLVRPSATNIIIIPSVTPKGYVGLTDVPVGQPTPLQVFAIVNRDNGDRFAFAPHGIRGCGNWIPGPLRGTSEATLLRVSPTMWEVTLPPGSVGALYRYDPGRDPTLKGLYHFQAHITLRLIDRN